MRQLGLASQHYHDVNKKFPTGARLPIDVSWPYQPTAPICGSSCSSTSNKTTCTDGGTTTITATTSREGTNAIQAQVIEILLCPSDPLPERVVEMTAANPRSPLLGPGVSMG